MVESVLHGACSGVVSLKPTRGLNDEELQVDDIEPVRLRLFEPYDIWWKCKRQASSVLWR